MNRTVEGGSSFKRQWETNATIYNTRQEKQRAICDVSTCTCYNSGAIEKFMLLKLSATKKKQWDREGESGFWPGYIYSTSIFFESSLSFFYQVAFIAKGISALPAISPSIVIWMFDLGKHVEEFLDN